MDQNNPQRPAARWLENRYFNEDMRRLANSIRWNNLKARSYNTATRKRAAAQHAAFRIAQQARMVRRGNLNVPPRVLFPH